VFFITGLAEWGLAISDWGLATRDWERWTAQVEDVSAQDVMLCIGAHRKNWQA
jgi:hypothetical protein